MILKTIRSFRFAFKGICEVFKNENNAKVHALATILAVIAGVFFRISVNEWLWVALAIALVWTTELLNTALEKLTDLVSPEHHPGAGAVKDLAVGAVLVCAAFAFVTGLVIFIPKVCLFF